MKIKLFAMAALFAVFTSGSAAQTKSHATEQTKEAKPQTRTIVNSPLKLLTSIPLPALKEGDFDHFAIDLEGHRLFLTAEENGKLLVFDTNSNKLIHTIEDLKAPHAVLYRKEFNKLFVVDGDESAVKIYDAQNYQLLGKVELAPDADSMAYDTAAKYMYVVNGGRGSEWRQRSENTLFVHHRRGRGGLQKGSGYQNTFRSCRGGGARKIRTATFL